MTSSNGGPTARTPPLPDGVDYTGWHGGPDPIIEVRTESGGSVWALAPERAEFFVGSESTCAISLPQLSEKHALLERRAERLRLYDQNSKHGTFFDGRRLTAGSVDLVPGDVFECAPVSFFCLNTEMQAHRPILVEIMGRQLTIAPERVMVRAAKGDGPFLIVGPKGSDGERLARSLHAMSTRRRNEFLVLDDAPENALAFVRQASRVRATVLVRITSKSKPLDPGLASVLYSSSYNVRVITLAPSLALARAALPTASLPDPISLEPLKHRLGDIEHLLDLMFERYATTRGSAVLRAIDLRPKNRKKLVEYAWPENLEELWEIAVALAAHEQAGTWRDAEAGLEGRSWESARKHVVDRVGMDPSAGPPSSFFDR